VTYRDLLRARREAGGGTTTHPVWQTVEDAPVEFRWSLAVWQKHGWGHDGCTCAHCAFTERNQAAHPDDDQAWKERGYAV
jgi:hypothetical protein